jgi:hypothetical protein
MIGRGLITAMLAGGGLLVTGASVDLIPTVHLSGPAQRAEAHAEAHIEARAGLADGMPLAHELTGEEFGLMVSELARTEPGAVAMHFRELARELTPATVPDVAASGGVAPWARAGGARAGAGR